MPTTPWRRAPAALLAAVLLAAALATASSATAELDATLYANADARAQFVGTGCGLCRSPWSEFRSKNWR